MITWYKLTASQRLNCFVIHVSFHVSKAHFAWVLSLRGVKVPRFAQ